MIENLMTEIAALWAEGKPNRQKTGTLLIRLQDELASPGHGTFLEALAKLEIPRSTAYDLMREARGEKRRPSERRNNQSLIEIVQRHLDKLPDYTTRLRAVTELRAFLAGTYAAAEEEVVTAA